MLRRCALRFCDAAAAKPGLIAFEPVQALLDDGYYVQMPWSVAWGDLDQFQHVNNVAYIKYFETIRTEYFRERDIPVLGNDTSPIKPILATINCRYRRPMVWPEDVVLGAKVSRLEAHKGLFVLRHCVWSTTQGTMAAVGDGDCIAYDYAAKKRVALPTAWESAMIDGDGYGD